MVLRENDGGGGGGGGDDNENETIVNVFVEGKWIAVGCNYRKEWICYTF